MRVTPHTCIGSLVARYPLTEAVLSRWGVRLGRNDLALSVRGLCEAWQLPLPALVGELDEAVAAHPRDLPDDERCDDD